MKVTAVHVETLELKLEEPFVIASSALDVSPCDVIRVETDEGLVGFGEAVPGYEFTGETIWTVQDVIGEYLGPATDRPRPIPDRRDRRRLGARALDGRQPGGARRPRDGALGPAGQGAGALGRRSHRRTHARDADRSHRLGLGRARGR